ncbi:MAG: hypothetical protein EOP04_11025, partial [Proteobacteria bacterium]
MKKYILPLFAFLALPALVLAQNNMVTNYNQHWNLVGSRQLPSKLGLDYATVQLHFLNTHVYGGSSSIPFSTSSELTNSEIDKNINRLRPINNIGAGLDMDWFGFSYKIEKEDEEVVTISAMITDRAAANLLYSKNLAQLLWKGNKQFAGQNINLGPLSVNAFHLREYALGAAMPIDVSDKFTVRAGMRLKYLQGIDALYMPKSDAHLFTEQDGRYLEFDMDYEMHTTLQDREDGSSGYDGTPIGSGFGTDLGITANFDDRFSGSFSLLDLGFITYRENTKMYGIQTKVRYEGAEVNNLFDDPEFEVMEEIEDKLEGEESTNEKFTMPTSTKIMLQGEYIIGAETKKHGREYNKGTAYFTYV